MVRIAALQAALAGLIGLRPHYEPNRTQYAPDLLESRSGIWLNDIHPSITAENLYQALPKLDPTSFEEYNPNKLYPINTVIRSEGELYLLVGEDTGQGPYAGVEWQKTNFVSMKLRQMLDNAATSVVNAIIQQKKIEGAKEVVADTQLYHGAGNITQRIVKNGRFCGFEIELKQSRDLVIRISRIGIQADTPNQNLQLYLYHTSQAEPIQIISPNFVGSGTFAWGEAKDLYLALDSDAYGPGGAFFLGYYEDDVAGQIIDKEKDWTNSFVVGVGCSSCNPQDVAAFQLWSQYLKFHPFSVASEDLTEDRTLFDDYKVKYDYASNFGLNVNISVECDITQFLARNESLLADAIAKQAVINILQIFACTLENNPTAEKLKQLALYQLDNREHYTPGLLKQLETSLAALSMDVANDNSPCLSKNTPNKTRITTGTSGNQNIDGVQNYNRFYPYGYTPYN